MKWKNSENEALFIDNPGWADSKGRDSIHLAEMVMKLREIKEVNAFLIVVDGNQKRIDIHLQAMIQLFKNIFSEAFINNTAFVFTNWGMSK